MLDSGILTVGVLHCVLVRLVGGDLLGNLLGDRPPNPVNVFPVAIPPLREQPSIAAQVADQLNHFEKVTQSVQFQIDRLREYRTRLIADVVTCKLDVRGVELPELEPEDALEPLSDSEEGELEEAEELLAAGEDSDAD